MSRNRRNLVVVCAAIVIFATAAFAARTFDQITVTGSGGGSPAITAGSWVSSVGKMTTVTADRTMSYAGDPSGKIILSKPASGNIIFTLPAPVASRVGWHWRFVHITSDTVTVTCNEKIMVPGYVKADSASTTGNIIAVAAADSYATVANYTLGTVIDVYCIPYSTGYVWLVVPASLAGGVATAD